MPIHTEVRALIEEAAERAADKAVRQLLINIGIDVTTPGAIKEHQQDINFLHLWRMWFEQRLFWWAVSGIGAILLAVLTANFYHIGKDVF